MEQEYQKIEVCETTVANVQWHEVCLTVEIRNVIHKAKNLNFGIDHVSVNFRTKFKVLDEEAIGII
jgi:hypothetical protein